MEKVEKWIKTLVEENKDDPDFIVQAKEILDEVKSFKPTGLEEVEEIKTQLTEKEDLIEQMKQENERLKKSFYETFVAGGVDVGVPNEPEEEELDDEPLGVDELLDIIVKE